MLDICVLCLHRTVYISLTPAQNVLEWDSRIEVELTTHSSFRSGSPQDRCYAKDPVFATSMLFDLGC